MAGIGFQLSKIHKGPGLNHIARSYGYAGILSSGPWIISVIAIISTYFLTSLAGSEVHRQMMLQFQACITYLIAVSQIISGTLQYGFTRYVADRLFEQKFNQILPNTLGIMLLITAFSLLAGAGLTALALPNKSLAFKCLVDIGLAVLCNIWLLSSLLSGLRAYKAIILSFCCGYGASVLCAVLLHAYGSVGLITGFILGQALLLLLLLAVLMHSYTLPYKLLSYQFRRKDLVYFSLFLAGFCFHSGIWVDKFFFWFAPKTEMSMMGNLHGSLIYDLPMFLAFFLMIPGLAVFLFRMETDFVPYYTKYYDAIRDGGCLTTIRAMHRQMALAARNAFFAIAKIQFIITLVAFVYSSEILSWFNFPMVHTHLFQIDMLSSDALVFSIAILNILFYLDKRKQALLLTILFVILNASVTMLTLSLGLQFFGYGFLISLIIPDIIGLYFLDRNFRYLTFETFVKR